MALKYNEFMLAMAISTFSLSATVAHAGNIDTTLAWNGSDSISAWGVPNTSTYGQTITADGSQTSLKDFTFYLNFNSDAPVNAQAFVYAWDPVGLRLTGNALFASDVFAAPSTASFNPVFVQTGGVSLDAGGQYVLFLTTSTIPGQSDGRYKWGFVSGSAYTGGDFVYQNNGTDFDSLGNDDWTYADYGDLAFKANFGPGTILSPGTYDISGLNVAFTPTFEGGTLRLDSDGKSYGDNFTLDSSATNRIDQNGNSATFNGAFVDATAGTPGNVTITNSGQDGVVNFAGMNTYTGFTTIDEDATLALVGQGRINKSSLVTVNGTFDVTDAASAQIRNLAGDGSILLGAAGLQISEASNVFSGTIAGIGGVVVGGGTLVLSGENTFTNGLAISNGATAVIGSGGTSGSITSDVLNYGTVAFNRSDAFTYGGVVTGPGAFELRNGDLTLTGNSSSSGNVSIAAGSTLRVGNGGTSGWIGGTNFPGTITVAGDLVYNRSGTQSWSGAYAGSGTITKAGTSTLSLTGDSSGFAGDTQVQSGTLQVSSNGKLGGAVDVNAGATLALSSNGALTGSGPLVVNGTFDVSGARTPRLHDLTGTGSVVLGSRLLEITDAAGTFGGAISGAGGVSVTGGSKVLTGENSFTGGLLIANGTSVSIGSGGTSGSIAASVLNEGTLTFNRNDASTYAGAVSGAGAFQLRNGDLTLTGNSSSTGNVSVAGDTTLRLGDGGSSGWIGGSDPASTTTVHGTLVYNHAGTNIWSAAHAGAGRIVKAGSDTLVLTGDSSAFAGQTTVESGALLVDNTQGAGHLGGSVDVASGAALGGAGTFGSGAGSTVAIASGATLNPGNGVGSLTIDGDLVFADGARFAVETTAGSASSDLVHVTGSATLAGTVAHFGVTGRYDPRSFYTILGADAGINGTFSGVTSDFAFLNPYLSYGSNDVVLELQRNDIRFANLARTGNQAAVAGALDSLTFGNGLYDAFVQLDDAGASAAFDQLTGEVHASVNTTLIQNSEAIRSAANNRLRSSFSTVAAPALPVMGFGPDENLDKMQGSVTLPASEGPAMWGSVFGSWGSQDGNNNAGDLDRSNRGLVTGVDGQLDTWRVGVMGGYSRSSFDVDSRSSSGDADNYHLGIYGGTQWGALGFRTGATYSWSEINTNRSAAFLGFNDSLTADYNAQTFQAFGELGYKFDTQPVAFEPFVNLAHVNVDTEGFTERGGASALTVDGTSTDTTFTTVGLRAETKFDLSGAPLTATGMIGWQHAFGETTPQLTQAFAGSSAFSIAGTPIDRNAAVVEAGLDYAITPAATLGLTYTGQFSSGAQEHGGQVGLNVNF